jgi:hypothetical protein
MSRLSNFPTIQLVQVVYVMITHDPSGVLVARSPDVPGARPSHPTCLPSRWKFET